MTCCANTDFRVYGAEQFEFRFQSLKLVFTVLLKMEQCNESFHLGSKTSLLCIFVSKISTVCSTCLHVAVSVLPLMALRVSQMSCVVRQQTDGLFVALAGTLQ